MPKIPDWVWQQEKTELARINQLRQSLPSRSIPIRSKPRGWREVGMFFSLEEHVLYPREREVTEAIKQFDPFLVPMGVYWVFKPEGSEDEYVFFRHVVGRFNDDPLYERPEGLRVDNVPSGYKGHIPNQVILIWEGEEHPESKSLPKAYKPWNWELHQKLKDSWVLNLSLQEMKQKFVHDKAEEEERVNQKAREEREYINKDLNDFVARKLEQISEVEMKEWALGGKRIKKSPKLYSFGSR